MKTWFIAGATLLGAFVLGGMALDSNVEARPKYVGGFLKSYPDLADVAREAKCAICHPGKDKKVRNDYGKAVATNLPKKNTTDAESILNALKKAESAKNADGKTYGEIIKSGKLPN